MINIKDKLNRSNLVIHRNATVDVAYLPREVLESGMNRLTEQLAAIDRESEFVDKYGLDILIEVLLSMTPPISINAKGMKFKNATFTEIPKNLDFSQCDDFYYMFNTCKNLTSVPELNTSNGKSFDGMLYNCTSLTSVQELDASSATSITSFFGSTTNRTLTYFGGLKNLKIDWNDNYGLAKLPNLSYESVIRILNNLYDFRGNGDTTTKRTLKLHTNHMSKLSQDDIAIATNKGWTLTA